MIGIISASQRLNSQSQKVAKYAGEIIKNELNKDFEIFELSAMDLPFSNSVQASDEENKNKISELGTKLSDCDGFIIICPEWNGSVTPILANFFLFFKGTEFAHKPALIVSVSANVGGAFVISSIRSHSYKNIYLNYIPEHIIIRGVNNLFNNYDQDTEKLEFIEKRLSFAINTLDKYCIAFNYLRKELLNNNENSEFFFALSKNGMS